MTRDAAAIGAGLAAVRPPRPIRSGERLHVVGAAGAGASAAALLAAGAGAQPSGCDLGGPSPYTPALDAAGISLAWSHDPGHVTGSPRPDRLAVTKALTAVAPDHPELEAARRLGIPVEPWQQVVADAAAGRRLVAVAGTHGKSTTSGWLVHVLVSAGVDPGAFVGALMPSSTTGGLPATARWGRGATFVVEADEYAGNFDAFRPNVAVLTGAEWDHPDVFADLDAVVGAFGGWLERAAHGPEEDGEQPILVANVSDPGVERLLERLGDWPGSIVATCLVTSSSRSLATEADAVVERLAHHGRAARAIVGRIGRMDPDGTEVKIYGLPGSSEPSVVRLPTAGRHNASNALSVAATAGLLGLGHGEILRGLAGFPGIGRRLERKGEVAGVAVYDDYGHHPTAIRETLLAVRQREPGRRVWAVYEPLTYHRTAALLGGFAEALAEADGVAVAEIWAGRDLDTSVASAEGLAAAVAHRRPTIPVAATGSPAATAAWLARTVRSGDVVLIMGGGHSYEIPALLLDRLASR